MNLMISNAHSSGRRAPDTVENTDMHSANTIKIAILLFIVASLVKAPDNIVAIKIPVL
jgi:hypothetical protein